MTCIIVDDEPLAVKLIESYVAKTPDLKLLGSYTDSVEAITAIKENPADLLFLDIQMPDINASSSLLLRRRANGFRTKQNPHLHLPSAIVSSFVLMENCANSMFQT